MKRSKTNFKAIICLATFVFFSLTSLIGCKEEVKDAKITIKTSNNSFSFSILNLFS